MTPQQDRSHECPKALLAEDDALIRELVAGYLLRLGYEVCEAPNGAEAIAILDEQSTNPFDLVVTDLLMPKASGEAVIEQARSSGACNRFLVITGNPFDPRFNPDTSSERACLLEKPFTFGDFEAKIHSLDIPDA